MLKNIPWAEKLLKDDKIQRAVSLKRKPKKASKLFEAKSALFELRFAGLIHSLNLTAEYEYKTGLGNSSVDFKIKKNNKTWLVELTSLKESKEVKKNTRVKGNQFSYISISKATENLPEVFDLIKVQAAIINKTINGKMKSIKFNKPKRNTYNIILVDMRAFNAGISDCFDCFNIVYGSELLLNPKYEFNVRYWIDENGKSSLIKGLFDKNYPNAENVRDRIHAIGFILKNDFFDNEMNKKIIFFHNPKFFKNMGDFKKVCPLV